MLADGNLLIAFSWENHSDHSQAVRFFQENPKVATCPITELNLIRFVMQKGASGKDAEKRLENFVARHRSRLVPCDLPAANVAGQCDGHRQTTDVYLAQLAVRHKLKLVTFDQSLAKRFPESVRLVAESRKES